MWICNTIMRKKGKWHWLKANYTYTHIWENNLFWSADCQGCPWVHRAEVGWLHSTVQQTMETAKDVFFSQKMNLQITYLLCVTSSKRQYPRLPHLNSTITLLWHKVSDGEITGQVLYGLDQHATGCGCNVMYCKCRSVSKCRRLMWCSCSHLSVRVPSVLPQVTNENAQKYC